MSDGGWDAETVRTVAGVWRLLQRAGNLLGQQTLREGPAGSTQLVAWPADLLTARVRNLLPDAAVLGLPEPVGDCPAELLRSAERLLQTLPPGAFPELPDLRVAVAELVGEVAFHGQG
jgi:hypothetical protein